MPRHREFNYRLATDDDDRFRLGIAARFAGCTWPACSPLRGGAIAPSSIPTMRAGGRSSTAFALGVYGSSWTFYGAVGTAKQDGLLYIAGYLGPLLLLAFGMPFFERLVRLAKHQNATSISDFLSARFGTFAPHRGAGHGHRAHRDHSLHRAAAHGHLHEHRRAHRQAAGRGPHWYSDTMLGVALMLALFAILFGTRGIDATEHHPGMVLAIAAESVFKLRGAGGRERVRADDAR